MILVIGQNLAWQKACTVAAVARGEVNRVLAIREFASSKGPNVARALRALGGTGEVVFYAGGATGRRAVDYLVEEGMRCKPVQIQAETRTCTTLLEPDGTSTELIEPSPRVTPDERDQMRRAAEAGLQGCRVLAIMGTAVLGETEDCYAVLVRAAHEKDIPVLVDSVSAEALRALQETPEVLKINSRELASLTGAPTKTPGERVTACRGLAARFGIRWFVITMGAAGVEAFDGKALLHAAPPRVDAVNAIGSGDAVASGIGWVIHEALRGRERGRIFSSELLREALLTAAAMGTANCMNPISGRVDTADYRSVREKTVMTEIPFT